MAVNVRRDALGRVVTKHYLADLSYEEFLYNDESPRVSMCICHWALRHLYNLRIFDENETCTSVIIASKTQLEIRPAAGPAQSWPLAEMLALHGKTSSKDLLLHLAN